MRINTRDDVNSHSNGDDHDHDIYLTCTVQHELSVYNPSLYNALLD